MVRQKVCVILVVCGKIIGSEPPDAVVPDHDAPSLIATIKHMQKGF
jgi:hypothetical protein